MKTTLKLESLDCRVTPAVHTWTRGGADALWSNPANWDSAGVPTSNEADGTIVVIPISDSEMNMNIATLAVDQIRFTHIGTSILTLSTPLTVNASRMNQNIQAAGNLVLIQGQPIILVGGTVEFDIDVTTATSKFSVQSAITGNQGLLKTGAGSLIFTTPVGNTYTGKTTIADGELLLATSTSDQGISNQVEIGAGSLLVSGTYEIPDSASVVITEGGRLIIDENQTEDITNLQLTGGTVEVRANAELSLRTNTNFNVSSTTVSSRITGAGTFSIPSTTAFAVNNGPADVDLICDIALFRGGSSVTLYKSGGGRMVLEGDGTLETQQFNVMGGILDIKTNHDTPLRVTSFVVGDNVGTVASAGVNVSQNNPFLSTMNLAITSDGYFSQQGFTSTFNTLIMTSGGVFDAKTSTVNVNNLTTALDSDSTRSPIVRGVLNISSQTIQVFDDRPDDDLSIVGVLSDSPSIKTGPGRLHVQRTDTQTQPFTINEGTLDYDFTTTTSPVIVNGGTFTGSGTIGMLTGITGTISVGFYGGTTRLTTAGLVLGSTRLFFDYFSPTEIDQLIVNGTVDVTGATLQFDANDTPAIGTIITMIQNDGNDAVTGIFNSLPEGSRFSSHNRTYQISYTGGDGNDVTLTAVDPGFNTPTISLIPPPIRLFQSEPRSFPFQISDVETNAADLTLTVTSQDTSLLPVSNVALSGSGTNRTVTITPLAGQNGLTTITLTATDGDGHSTSQIIPIRILAQNAGLPESLIGARQFTLGPDQGTDYVRTYSQEGTKTASYVPFASTPGGIRVASADFNADGIADVVMATGPGVVSQVRILDGKTGQDLFAISPFESAFLGGIYVAAGDLDGDGIADLVITPDEGGGPRVRVFRGKNWAQIADFYGIDDPNFRGGARATIGDLNGDGTADLFVAAGFGGGPRVAAFDGPHLGSNGGPKLFNDFFVFEDSLRNGIYLAAGDVNGDGYADLVAGGGPGGGPRVYVLDGQSLSKNGSLLPVANFFAGDPNNRGGIRVAVKNLNNDAYADIVTAAGPGGGMKAIGYSGRSLTSGNQDVLVDLTADFAIKNGLFVG